MEKRRIGVYSVNRKGKDVGYIRFRLKDDSDDIVHYRGVYIRNSLIPGYTTYTHVFEDSLDFYMTDFMDALELTIIEIYEEYYTI